VVAFGKNIQVVSEIKRKIFQVNSKQKWRWKRSKASTANEVDPSFGVHQTQVGLWRKELK
jgi:hypothetical protein